MRKQYMKLLAFPLCLAIVLTFAAIPVFADEDRTESSVIEEAAEEPIEEPVEVSDDTPLDGDWCYDEENHWRADAVNQGIPTPHVDEDKDGICDVCQWVFPAEEPIEDSNEEPVEDPIDEPTEDPNGESVDVPDDTPADVESEDDEPDTNSQNEEPPVPTEDHLRNSLTMGETAPETGDDSDLPLWTVMMILSVGALTGVVLSLRKTGEQ